MFLKTSLIILFDNILSLPISVKICHILLRKLKTLVEISCIFSVVKFCFTAEMLKIFLLTVFIRVAVTINCTNRSAFTSNTANARITSRIISSYNNDTKNKETPLLFWKNYNSNNGITLLVDDISSTQMSAYNFLKRLDEVDPEVLQRTPIQLMKFNSSGKKRSFFKNEFNK